MSQKTHCPGRSPTRLTITVGGWRERFKYRVEHQLGGCLVTTPTVLPLPRQEPPGRVAELRSLSRTTPGVLILFTAAVVLVSVLVGVFTAVSVQSRAQALDNLAGRSGPLSVAAQDIYRSLSDADATANSAFLAGGLEAADVRTRYENDIAQAESALAIAVAAREPADLVNEDTPLAVLSAKLSVYTGLVETARANNRQGLPVGAAYQREASNLMRTELLPAAQDLYTTETAGVGADQDSASSLPLVEVVLGLISLAVLFYAQRFLRRRTRRRLNVGLVIATVAAVASLLWVVVATIGVMANVNASQDDGSTQTDVLARARIATLAARGDETLTLVARGSGAEFEKSYTTVRAELAGKEGDPGLLADARGLATSPAVADAVAAATDYQESWHKVHVEIRKADDSGDYAQAVQLTIGTDENGAAAEFDRVDEQLDKAIDSTTATFNDEVSQASNALTGTVVGVILLALIAAGSSVLGIWQRLKEYR